MHHWIFYTACKIVMIDWYIINLLQRKIYWKCIINYKIYNTLTKSFYSFKIFQYVKKILLFDKFWNETRFNGHFAKANCMNFIDLINKQLICISICLTVYLFTHPCVYLPTFVTAYLSTRILDYLSTYVTLYLFTCLPICMSIFLYAYLSICLPVYLSTCLPVICVSILWVCE